jgi:hypothetical protein
VGAARRRARPEPRCPNCRGASGKRAELGRARSRIAAQLWSRAGSRLGWRPRRWCPASATTGWRPDLGRSCVRAHPACGANVGRAATAATFDATAATTRTSRSAAGCTARGAELGRDGSASGAGLGGASTRRAPSAGASAGRTTATPATTCRRSTATSANVGISSCRRCASGRCAGSFVGFRSAGRSGAQLGIHRLGIASGQLSAGGATCAFLERARRGVVMGRAQDRGACRSARAVMGRARERRAAGLDPARICSAGATASRMGAAGRGGSTATRPGRVRGPGCRRRRSGRVRCTCGSRGRSAGRIASACSAALAAARTTRARRAGAIDRRHDSGRHGSGR